MLSSGFDQMDLIPIGGAWHDHERMRHGDAQRLLGQAQVLICLRS